MIQGAFRMLNFLLFLPQWYNPSPTAGPLSWLVLSHSGVHFAYQPDSDTVKLLKTLRFEDIYSIVKVDARVVTISLRNNDRYDIICHMVSEGGAGKEELRC